jgi:hypothetical protein
MCRCKIRRTCRADVTGGGAYERRARSADSRGLGTFSAPGTEKTCPLRPLVWPVKDTGAFEGGCRPLYAVAS